MSRYAKEKCQFPPKTALIIPCAENRRSDPPFQPPTKTDSLPFPVYAPDIYISLLNGEGREIALIRALADLDEDSRGAVQACLDQYYLIPEIKEVLSCTDRAGALFWRVMTDRGEVQFRIRNRHADIKLLYGTNRVLVRDADDNRYEIPDMSKLNKRSRRLLFYYV